jgi:RimJ/RimL family protein N-acetyltransferase
MVRFDQSERDSGLWEVSIAINPEFRGRGFGVIALRMACAEILADGKAHVLNAKVRHENHPSLRLFERCGFNEESRDNEFVFLRRTDFENISNQETARR